MPLRVENGGICSVLLIDMIAKITRSTKTTPHTIGSVTITCASESGMTLLRGCMKFKAWQSQVVGVDGQLGQGAVPHLGSRIVVPSVGVSKGPNLGAIMYHSWCITT
jgi:hypothetical protein